MVTRVDKKPIIHHTTALRLLRPAVVASDRRFIDFILKRHVSGSQLEPSSYSISEAYEDVEMGYRWFGVDDPYSAGRFSVPDEEELEAIRVARSMFHKHWSPRAVLRDSALMEEMASIQRAILKDCKRIYTGTEAVYQVLNLASHGHIFPPGTTPDYSKWATETAKEIMMAQSASMFIHPTAMHFTTAGLVKSTDFSVWNAWVDYKRMETVALRISSRKNFMAHAHYAGKRKIAFEPAFNPEDDFLLPWTGFAAVKPEVKGYLVMGLKYIIVGDRAHVLSHDDCINLATMSQCIYRAICYFSTENGYPATAVRKARALIDDMIRHCCSRIDSGLNFADFIRSVHILAQKEFNDAYEDDFGKGFGWEERSRNYDIEAAALDKMCHPFFNRACDLAINRMDRLNTCFLYHALVGDEMIIKDLVSKVKEMESKVKPADETEWSRFIRFVKAYLLCRFMYTFKRKPKADGDVKLLNSDWAKTCIMGTFRMPPQADWGKVWISAEYRYTEFADTWHLECQDVAYVVKDSGGIMDGRYSEAKEYHSELLMAMKNGSYLDVTAKTTPQSARARILEGRPTREVVLTCAPKSENAKPSWKKRVTFAADCEFRKMQAEVDRNCRRAMGFIRGPSLGVDQCILEKQFADIANTTAQVAGGVICSHDISAWSESMDRERKFEFEEILLTMFDKPEMINIKRDWEKIVAVVTKQGCKESIPIKNGSFQGFDGSASTILHSMILIYCIDTARRDGILSTSIKTNMATLIDDCIALMVDLCESKPANAFWEHLKKTYAKLGFIVDDLKSIFSDIKAIYLSRRFLLGGEVPSDLKIFIKAHSSYEDPLRNTIDVAQDIFGGMRGAVDANGDVWFTYYHACLSVLSEIAHNYNIVRNIPAQAAAIFALAPTTENGWGFPSIISWCTNDVVDKLMHFNAMIENNACHMCAPDYFVMGVKVMTPVAIKAINAIKNQPWRMVSHANIFTSPFEVLRDGPIKPDMIRRNSVQDILKEHATAEPWASLLGWNRNKTTEKVRELLINSGPLHAPTLSALVNCMPDNYRLSLIGKASGSQSLFNSLHPSVRMTLKRRVHKAAENFFNYTYSIYTSTNMAMTVEDYSQMTHTERTRMEREEFYSLNGVIMTDHTFPDPVSSFTKSGIATKAEISPNNRKLRAFDLSAGIPFKASHYVSTRGMYVPRRSGRVWEVTCEHAKGWDTISQRIAMGLAILARAEADGHKVNGLLSYFTKAWNEFSTIDPETTNLIAIHGSIKRLDANPGSATHPIIVNRNILSGFDNHLKPALDAIPWQCKEMTGHTAHLHDLLAHDSSMRAITGLIFSILMRVGQTQTDLVYNMAIRKSAIIPEDERRMNTNSVADAIDVTIIDGEDNYGLLQACPSLIWDVGIPTMTSSWVSMINALVGRDMGIIEDLKRQMAGKDTQEILTELRTLEVTYTPAVILAAPPADRGIITANDPRKMVLVPTKADTRMVGDGFTKSVRPMTSKFTRELIQSKSPEIISAILVRSVIWDKFEYVEMSKLAQIFYDDPDKDLSCLDRCNRKDFWKSVIVEIKRNCKNAALSDMTMSAFRSLGIYGIHLNHSNDLDKVAQAVASYFGAHLRDVCTIIADRITSVAGRSAKDFEAPIMERIISNSPGVTNARKRQKFMVDLFNLNVASYAERIQKLKDGAPTHRGDVRAASVDASSRIDDLSARKMVYENIEVYNKGELSFHYKCMMAAAVLEAVSRAPLGDDLRAELEAKLEIIGIKPFKKRADTGDRPTKGDGTEERDKFIACFDIISYFYWSRLKREVWDAPSCSLGARMALYQVDMDLGRVQSTTFAVSPAEFAPKLFKRIIQTPAGLPVACEVVTDTEREEDTAEEVDWDKLMGLLGGDELVGYRGLDIEYWKALYTLLYTGTYYSDDVNRALGTDMPAMITAKALLEAHLDDFEDATIRAAFPTIEADYFACGTTFNAEWLNRDEAAAYTTDEMAKIPGGFLF